MQTPKILIVDDELAHLEAIIDIIEETGNSYRVLQAFDGNTAIIIAEKEIPDLIIADWDMPGMSGIELIKQLKSNEKTRDIPIIMCTGVMTTSENLATSLEAGAVDYVRKPVDKIELPARINSMLKLSESYKKVKEQNLQLEQYKVVTQKINNELNKQKQKTIDSIKSAQKIQTAILPSVETIKKILPEHFIFYLPKDIVSGDFYWIQKINKYIIIAVADCTGHGVPGAFMSMLGFAFLNEIIRKKDITQPNQVLEELRKQVKSSLHQTGQKDDSSDGMDISLCVIETESNKMEYACANNPVYIVRKNHNQNKPEIIELKSDPMPIGIYINEYPFNNYEIQLKQNDCIYLFTDGYSDQFGGRKNDKFMSARFNELLLSIYDQPMHEQKSAIEKTFNEWKGNHSQVDDVLVMGFRI